MNHSWQARLFGFLLAFLGTLFFNTPLSKKNHYFIVVHLFSAVVMLNEEIKINTGGY